MRAKQLEAAINPRKVATARFRRGRFVVLSIRAFLLLAVVGGVTWRERPTSAATGVNVTINAGTPLSTIPSTAFGLNSAVWDGNLLDSGVPDLLHQAGVAVVRFPGGSTSDSYHWQTNSITKGQGGYANPSNTFDAFMGQVQKAGAEAMVTVNYGSNAAGTGGGDPTEAANWVSYANVTKHYGVRYWEIGNEIYGNGSYGANWETDLHSSKGPTAYANNALAFITAMKNADPTIKVGVVLTAPGNWPDGQTPDWNRTVLSIVGSKIDFAIVHWYAQGPGSESDAGLLNSTNSIANMVTSLRALIAQYCGANAPNVQMMVTETNSVSYNPGKQTVSLVNALFLADNYMGWLERGIANVDWWDLHNSVTPGNNNSPILYGNTAYGDYGMVSDGTAASGQSEPPAETPFPPYYGLRMLSNLGKPGDQMVGAQSDQGLVSVHAVKQANGNLAVLLINKNPGNSNTVTITLNGYTAASSGTRYVYGEGSTAITSGTVTGLGSSFTQIISPYSLTTLVLTPGSAGPTDTPTTGPSATVTTTVQATATASSTPALPTGTATVTHAAAPHFGQTTTISPASIPANGSTSIKTTITVTSGAFTDGIVDIEVYNASRVKVAQHYFEHQTITAGQSAPYTYTWTAPSTSGTYNVAIGTFNGTWATNYFWTTQAGKITVTGGTPPPAFRDATTAQSATPQHGTSSTIHTTITVTSGSLHNGIVDLEVYNNANWAKVSQKYFSGQNLATGSSTSYQYTWPVPTTTGQYTVMVGVFGANWTPNSYWNSSAAHISVK